MFWALMHFGEIWAQVGANFKGWLLVTIVVSFIPLYIWLCADNAPVYQQRADRLLAKGLAILVTFPPFGYVLAAMDIYNVLHRIPDNVCAVSSLISLTIACAVSIVFYFIPFLKVEKEDARHWNEIQSYKSENSPAKIEIKKGQKVGREEEVTGTPEPSTQSPKGRVVYESSAGDITLRLTSWKESK